MIPELDNRQERAEEERRKQAWLITFTDLVSLMLTFFVLLFSMSNVKIDDWQNIIDSLSQTLNPTTEENPSASTALHNISTAFRKRAINLDYLSSVLDEHIREDALLQGAKLVIREDRLILALPGNLLFQPGQAEMTDQARDALFRLGGLLQNIGNQIGVNGHTDPVPLEGGAYASNWELSAARAASVANALTAAGYEDRLIAYGFGSSRFETLPNATEAERQAYGRRVDIVVLPTSGGRL